MAVDQKNPSVLLVDADENFLQECKAGNKSAVDVRIATERIAAQLKLANKDIFFTAVCLNASACAPYALPLVRFTKAHRPATPIYFLSDTPENSPKKELLDEWRIEGVITKPIKPKDLINAIFPYTLFEMEKLVNLSKKDQSAADTALSAEDKEMHAISAKDFLCGSKSFFDVYVRLASGKYIKLLKAGDNFDLDRVKSYLVKGVTHFYMRKEAQEVFLQYCDKVTETLLKEKSVPVEMKIDQVLNFGKETMDFMKDKGFNEATLQTAMQFVKHAHSLTRDLAPSVLDTYLEKVAFAAHGSGTLMVLSLFMETLGYKDRKTIEVIALGGLFHDIGLMNMPEKFQHESEDELTEAELAEFHKHPIVGEEMLKGIRRLNPLVPQVVLQHHERRTRNGFPYKLGAGAISPVSEMIGIADTFNQLIRRSATQKRIDPIAEMENKYFNSFSFPVIEAFQKIFCKKL